MSKTIHHIFRNLKESKRDALWVNNQTYTYRELGKYVEKIAHSLQSSGNYQQMIAVFSNRNIASYAGLLGVLASGNIYLPLSKSQPISRILEILKATNCKTILATSSDYKLLEELGFATNDLEILWLSDDPTPEISGCKVTTLKTHPHHNPFTLTHGKYAYIMFTSGTTGRPKGIAITHEQLDQYVKHINSTFPFSCEDKFSQHADLTFDISVHDWAVAFSNQASLYVVPELVKSCPVDFIAKHKLTCWLSVPSVINLSRDSGRLKSASLSSLKRSFFIGQTLSISSAETWYEAAPNSRIFNLYGPTEGTIAISIHEWEPLRLYHSASVPIGKVFSTQAARLDKLGSDSGELWLSGTQVIDSYWKNTQANKKSFIQIDSRQWYKTGDVVCLLPDGEYSFLGRTDHQVKIQGYRIEPQEIEHTSRQFGVESIAVPFPLDECQQPIAITLAVTTQNNIDELRDYLKTKLPKYMQPQDITFIPEVPYNHNGKVDIRALQNILSTQYQPKANGEKHG